MSQNNPIRLFVTHAWDTSDEYLRIFEYLESARNFFYKNLSAPDKAPKSGGVEGSSQASGPSQAGCTKWCSVTTGSSPCAWQFARIFA